MRRDDEGYATIIGVGLIAVVLALAGAALCLSGIVVARHQAESAADLGALAAAKHALEGQGAACEAAQTVVRRQGARLVRCALEELDAVVETAVRPPGRLGELGEAHARARAGAR